MIFKSILHRKTPPCRNVPRFDPARAGGCPPLILQLSRTGGNVQTRVQTPQSKCVGSKLRYHTHMAGISYT